MGSPRGVEYARRLGEFADFIISGDATNLVCVTISRQAVACLAAKLTKVPQYRLSEVVRPGLFTKGDWSGFGDSSGAVVCEGMRLVRMQVAAGTDFIDAPLSFDSVLETCGTSEQVTLVFVTDGPPKPAPTPARLWTSSLRRTGETAAFIKHPMITCENGKPWEQMSKRVYRNLDEVYAGEYEGLTYKEIRQRDPHEASLRMIDKLGYRYPRGESYYDLIARLESVVEQMEGATKPVLIVSHQAVLRILYSWLAGISRESATEASILQHAVVKIVWDGTGKDRVEVKFPLGPGPKGGVVNDGQRHF